MDTTGTIKRQVEEILGGRDTAVEQVVLAYLSGAIPPVEKGLTDIVAAGPELTGEDATVRVLAVWLRLQEDLVRQIGNIMRDVVERVNIRSKGVRERLVSGPYLGLVKSLFGSGALVRSDVKRRMLRNLLVNAAVSRRVPDSALMMFAGWLDRYSDDHLEIIGFLARTPESTRRDIWLSWHDAVPAEDSAETDYYKLLIQDLTTGYVIRQARDKDYYGNFLKIQPRRRGSSVTESDTGPVTVSAFDDERAYVLTALGTQFAQYIFGETEAGNGDP